MTAAGCGVAGFERECRMGNIVREAEEAQELEIDRIARWLVGRRGSVRVVLVGGPSSAGKTTFSKRLEFHLGEHGAKTLAISTDDYFVGDERNPRDGNGNLDYEHIRAMDLDRLNENLLDLASGREALLPRFDFHTHAPMAEGRVARLESGAFIIIEGLHCLNPELTPQLPPELKTVIRADTVTDAFAGVPGALPGDQRLVRRIIRDMKYRGRAPADTIGLWNTVRAGEERWIRPFECNAETVFDTTLAYEPGVLRTYALPALRGVRAGGAVRDAARRLAAALEGFGPLGDGDIPGYSILREYIGGSIIEY